MGPKRPACELQRNADFRCFRTPAHTPLSCWASRGTLPADLFMMLIVWGRGVSLPGQSGGFLEVSLLPGPATPPASHRQIFTEINPFSQSPAAIPRGLSRPNSMGHGLLGGTTVLHRHHALCPRIPGFTTRDIPLWAESQGWGRNCDTPHLSAG